MAQETFRIVILRLVVFASLLCAVGSTWFGPCPLYSRVEEDDVGCDKCRCCRYANGEYEVTCRENFSRVPPLPAEATTLFLPYSYQLRNLTRSSFPHLPKLTRLSMSSTTLMSASSDCFHNLPQLTSLDRLEIQMDTVTRFLSSAPKLRHVNLACLRKMTQKELENLFHGLKLISLTTTDCNLALDHRFPLEVHPKNINIIRIDKTSATTNIQLPESNVEINYPDSRSNSCLTMSSVKARGMLLHCNLENDDIGTHVLDWIDNTDCNVSIVIDATMADISGDFLLENRHIFHSMEFKLAGLTNTFIQNIFNFTRTSVVQRLSLELTQEEIVPQFLGSDFLNRLVGPQLSVLELTDFPVGAVADFQFPQNLREFYCANCQLKCSGCHVSKGLRKLHIDNGESDADISIDIRDILSSNPDLEEIVIKSALLFRSLYLLPHHRLRRLELWARERPLPNVGGVNVSGLTNLESLRIQHALSGDMVVSKSFTISHLKRLEALDLSYSWFKLNGSMASVLEGLDSLRNLYLKRAGKDLVSRFPFWGSMDRLTDLLQPVSDTLETLDLSDNYISNLPSAAFAHMLRLKYLDLSGNYLATLDGFMLRDSILISHVDFTDNKLEVTNEGGVDCLSRLAYLRELLLSGNRFRCVCATRKLRDWMKRSLETGDVNFRYNGEVCPPSDESAGESFLDFRMAWIDCDFHKEAVVLGGTAIGLLLILSSVYMTYYFRWDIMFWWVVKRRHRFRRQHNINPSRRFHAFLSYASTEQLLAERMFFELEEGRDVKFKIAYDCRDFMPGETIADNIIRCIDQSEKVIFLISKQFLDRDWTTFELNFAQMRCFDHGRNMIILIFVEKFDSSELPQRIRALCRHVNYLEYPDPSNTRATQNFWHRLRLALAQDSDLYQAPDNAENERGEEIPDIPYDEEQYLQDYRELMAGRRTAGNSDDCEALEILESLAENDIHDDPDTSDDEQRPLVGYEAGRPKLLQT